MDLERKMENIEVSSDNDEEDDREPYKKSFKNPLIKENIMPEQVPRQEISAKKKSRVKGFSSDEDSEDDADIYAKISAKNLYQPAKKQIQPKPQIRKGILSREK